ncbi:MAG: hypothetical protein KDE31_25510, partial [Caldilineaceae bacterium]|nr:hypothetical protein [Caldilineaceae bacterium]
MINAFISNRRLRFSFRPRMLQLMMTAVGLILVLFLSSCTYTMADLAIHAHPVPPAGHFIQAATTTEVLDGPVTVALAGNVPDPYARQIFNELVQVTSVEGANGAQPLNVLASPDNARAVVRVARAGTVAQPLLERFYAVVVPFATTLDDIPRNELQQRWQGFG